MKVGQYSSSTEFAIYNDKADDDNWSGAQVQDHKYQKEHIIVVQSGEKGKIMTKLTIS